GPRKGPPGACDESVHGLVVDSSVAQHPLSREGGQTGTI
ncbi:hypothetical protein QIP00_gp1, partial [ssRNA phage Zoerhiza.1_7]